MLAANWMSSKLVSIAPDDSLPDAVRLMKENQVRHIPVLSGDRLVGIITDRDTKRASASNATSLEVHELIYLLNQLTVARVMTREVITIGTQETVEQAAVLMHEHKISGLPVLDEQGSVVGMLTQDDVFEAMISLSGVKSGGVQFAIEISDQPGHVKCVEDLIRQYGGRLVSAMTTSEGAREGFRRTFIRMKNVERERLQQLQEDLARVGRLQYVLDSWTGPGESEATGVRHT